MEIDRECCVCKEDASYFCRLCATHQCAEHLCLHLNVAWETNTWAHRNKENYDEDSGVREDGHGRFEQCLDEPVPRTDLQNTPKPLPAYTEAELQTQYKFYITQARRIRIELERRAVSLESPEENASRQLLSQRSWKLSARAHIRPRVFPRSLSKHVEVLLSAIREHRISIEQASACIKAPL